MAAFATLADDQKKTIVDYSTQLRAAIGQYARALRDMNNLNISYNATVSGALAAADAKTPVIDTTGAAGAVPLSPDDMVTLTSHMQAALSIYDAAHLAVWVRACGPTNL